MTDQQQGDKSAIDALTASFFQAVSFQSGAPPAYPMLHTLFIESGLLIRNSGTEPEITSVEQFIESRQQLVSSGDLTDFEESELAEQTDIFGNIAHRLSTYQKRGVRRDGAFQGRGVISMQMIRTRSGWRISAMAWDDERTGLIIPSRYLPG